MKTSAKNIVDALHGVHTLDIAIRGARIVNVFDGSIRMGDVGVVGDRIVAVGDLSDLSAATDMHGEGRYLLPGFVDSHMHLESSMLLPAHFARIALSCGTTTCLADPHEIANVMGIAGVRALVEATSGLPLHVLVCAPSTIPSAPGLEGSGYSVDASQIDKFARGLPQIMALGEVMDFNGVASGDARILGVVEAGIRNGWVVDGHAGALAGRELQAFRAVGITSDHTTPSAEKLREELALGFTVQIQDCMLSAEMVKAMNEAAPDNRICLVTDDVPLEGLMHEGHLNHVVAHAIELGLDPIRAIRFATVNGAQRLRLEDVGGIAPGMRADLQLVEDIRHPRPWLLLSNGNVVVRDGSFVCTLPQRTFPLAAFRTMNVQNVSERDFAIEAPAGGECMLNVIRTDGISFRTALVKKSYSVVRREGRNIAEVSPDLKMAVFNRHGAGTHAVGVIEGMPGTRGAFATTYAHDCHNLVVYGGNDADSALAANTLIKVGGGMCVVSRGKVLSLVRLPVAGLLSEEEPEQLLGEVDDLLNYARQLGFSHKRLLSFFTLMALSVSPDAKLSDRGLVDVLHRRLLPVVTGEEKR